MERRNEKTVLSVIYMLGKSFKRTISHLEVKELRRRAHAKRARGKSRRDTTLPAVPWMMKMIGMENDQF
jgi:hypothetical protein